MKGVQTARLSAGLKQAKYYGKWSFARVLGAQELVACLASVANAAVHLWYIPMLLRAALSVQGAGASETATARARTARVRERAPGGEERGGTLGVTGATGGGDSPHSVDGGAEGSSHLLSPSPSSPLPPSFAALWLTNAVVNINGWTWSAVFHARDTPWTHHMDYTSANVIFFYALFTAIVRAHSWHRWHSWQSLLTLNL
jgi:hypothetical protein